MRQSAIAQILSTADADGEAYTLNIFTTASGDSGWSDAKLIRFHHHQQENMLEIEINAGNVVYINGDFIEAIKVNK
jgi:hypothetical protein